jgi:hypothetical protein
MVAAVFVDHSGEWTIGTFATAACCGIAGIVVGLGMFLNFRGIADRWQGQNVRSAMRRGGLIRIRQARVAARTFRATGLVIGGTGGIIGLALAHSDHAAIRAIGIGIAAAGGALSLLGLLMSITLLTRASAGKH